MVPGSNGHGVKVRAVSELLALRRVAGKVELEGKVLCEPIQPRDAKIVDRCDFFLVEFDNPRVAASVKQL